MRVIELIWWAFAYSIHLLFACFHINYESNQSVTPKKPLLWTIELISVSGEREHLGVI